MNAGMDTRSYRALRLEVDPDGVLEVRLGSCDGRSVLDRTGHAELARLWREADGDDAIRAVIVRGVGKDLSMGGDMEFIESMATDYPTRAQVLREARDIVIGLLDFSKPVVSMLHGRCIGAGLVPALLADISVAADDAMIMDGHLRAGLVPGDHAVLVWPLLCGMAKAKYLLLLNDPLTGAQAEQIGLVSVSLPADRVADTAREFAGRLASGPREAIGWTKHSLNAWLRNALPTFEVSLALQMASMAGAEAQEGISAIKERRPPRYGQ
jgi:enoyl-CoA hydratase